LTCGPIDTHLYMPLATVLRVVVAVMLLDGYIGEMDVGVVDVFSVVVVARVAEPSESMCISAISWYSVRERGKWLSESKGQSRTKSVDGGVIKVTEKVGNKTKQYRAQDKEKEVRYSD
jgi:hypothetical protein